MKARSLGLLLAALLFPLVSSAAELTLSPASGSFAKDKEFVVKVLVKPAGGESINAADGTVTFDPAALSVTSVTKEGSTFSLWTADPGFSNSAGTVTFSGGTPTAFSSQGTVLSITFKGKVEGDTTVSFSSGSILAADGQGTDVYTSGGEASFAITAAAAEPKPKPVTETRAVSAPIAGGATPFAPVITSSTHDSSDKYYSTSTAVFSWKLSADATGVRTIFSDADDAIPDDVQEESDATSQVVEDITDGEWYFFAQFKNDFGWGEIGKKKILVDVTPPEEFDMTLFEGEGDGAVPSFAFQTDDTLSGMDRYEIEIAGAPVATVRAGDLIGGMYPVPPQDGGPQPVVVKAYDKAGNVREAAAQLNLPFVAKPTPKGEEDVNSGSGWTIERILVILFAMLIGALIGWNVYTKRTEQRALAFLFQEIAAIREKNDKIFATMREEFEQMVNDLDEQPQLTPKERDFLENMKEVLDISEEVLDSSLEELKKMARGQQ